jgi:hypothetical protein
MSNLTESLFDKKLFSQNGHLTEKSSDRKFIWPKSFSEKCSFSQKAIRLKIHLTESFFSKNGHLTEKSFDRKIIWPKVNLTEKSFDRMFFFQKW